MTKRLRNTASRRMSNFLGRHEVKAHELVDAIVEVTETGNSLRANNLRCGGINEQHPAPDRQ